MKNIKLWLSVWTLAFMFLGCEGLNTDNPTKPGPDIVAGLKEALRIGTDSTVKQLNLTDGYFKNEVIKILLPPEAVEAQQFINSIGGGPLVDELILKMNRAAEDAAVEAKPIFVDAITGISITDGMAILKGVDTAATKYLKDNTYTNLSGLYRPRITNSMEKVGAQQVWSSLAKKHNDAIALIPFNTRKPLPDDISLYVTDRALTGLFHVVGNKERDIRKNVKNRVTQLLQEVFALQD